MSERTLAGLLLTLVIVLCVVCFAGCGIILTVFPHPGFSRFIGMLLGVLPIMIFIVVTYGVSQYLPQCEASEDTRD